MEWQKREEGKQRWAKSNLKIVEMNFLHPICRGNPKRMFSKDELGVPIRALIRGSKLYF